MTIFRQGRNCAAVVHAPRVALLVDGEAYYGAFERAAERAERSILVLAWDFDSRMSLEVKPGEEHPPTLGEFLNGLASRKRRLRVRILDWDYPMIYGHTREIPPIYGITWKPHRRIEFRFDDTHPLAGSHHQKIVAIDDKLAFSGGMDLAARRFDTPEHAPNDPRRTFRGEPYPPVHDVMIAVDGEAAEALAAVARRRWHAVARKAVPRVRVEGDAWPTELPVDLTDVRLAISLTEPRTNGREGVKHVEQLYLDMISRAQRYIYIENQYFTSKSIGDALAARLDEPDGPEIVLVTRLLSHGWLEELTMTSLRTRLVRKLREADRHGRFFAYYPHVEGLADGTCVDLHSKVMIVDDEWLRVGSSNICNRSMGVDTECDVTVEAEGKPRARAAIRAFRDRLLAEHAGTVPETLAAGIEKAGSMAVAIARVGSERRRLRALEASEIPEGILNAASIGDPESPISVEDFVERFSPDAEPRRPEMLPVVAAFAIVAAIALALAWRYTPLAGAVSPASVLAFARSFADYWWAPLVVILAYTPAMVVMFPRPLITLTAVVTFGAWAGFAYAMTGVLLAAIVGYLAGEYVERDTVRRFAGRRLNRLSVILKRGGFFAVTLVRLVPIAPFVVVSVVMGAMRIRLHNFVIGTALGMTPGMLAATVLSDQLAAALADPARVNPWLVGAAVAALAALAYGGHWWLGRIGPEHAHHEGRHEHH